MQDTSAVSTTISRFAANSRMTQSRIIVSGDNSISAPVSMTTHQYKSDSIAIPPLQRDSKANQSLEPFFPSTGRSKPFFASKSAAYIQSANNEFPASADEGTIAISNTNTLLGTYTTTGEEEAEPENISFSGTSTLMKKSNTEKTDATDILENYTTLLDVPDMEDKDIIKMDTTYLERYEKTSSNIPDLPQRDNSIVIDAIDMKKYERTPINTKAPSISSAKNSNDFETILILNTYNKADSKSTMIATNINEAISNTNTINTISNINTIHPVLNYRMYKESNNLISNSDNKTMLAIAKNMMPEGDLIIFKTNGITSTKHYANSNPTEPMTNTNINFKITWPSENGTITEGRHTVQIENITTPNNNNIVEATGFKVDDSITKYHSHISANAYLKTNKNNFKSMNTDETEFVIPVIQKTANMDQDDEVVEEVIFIYPDTSTTEIRRKVFSPNSDADYAQTSGKKIILLSDIPNMSNPLFKHEVKPFAMDSTNLMDNRGDRRTHTGITPNEAKAKMNIERTSVFKTANFQSNITPIVSINHPGTAESIDFSEDSVADMISASEFGITPSDKSTASLDKAISLSTNNNHAGGSASPNPKTDFPVHKGYTLLSGAESPVLMPNARNDQAQNFLLITDDSLTGAWISDPVAESLHLINDDIIQKWKINKASVDPLKLPLESTFLTTDFTSPNDLYNVIASASKQTTNIIDSSDLKINKAIMTEGRPTVTISSLSARTAGIPPPRKRFGSLIDKGMANEEELTPYVEVKSVVEDGAVFQVKEGLPPAHNFKYFESGDSGFERNGSVAVVTTKSLPQLNSITPIAEEVIIERDFTTSGEKNVDVLYDVIKPENDKIHFKTMATKTKVNGLDESATIKQNVDTAEGIEFLTPSNSILQTGTMDHRTLPNLYYNVITDNPLTITKENQNIALSMIKHKLSLSTMDNAHFTDDRDGYHTSATVTSSNGKRLTSKDKMAGTKINIPLGITTVPDDISSVNKNSEVITDLASIVATSPIKKGILIMNKVNTFNNKLNKLGDEFTISREDPKVSRGDSTLLTVDSSTFMKSVAPPQGTNPVKKTSFADIIIPKAFHSTSTPATLRVAVTTASKGDVDNTFYIPRYESENSFKEDITLKYVADPPEDIDILAEKEDILKEENVRDHIYIIPIAGDNVPNGNNLAAKYYSLNSDVYNSIRSKGTTQTIANKLEFENPETFYMAEVSKPLLGKFTPEFQETLIIRNRNSGAEQDAFFGGDILYSMVKENVPKGYTFSPRKISTFTTSNFRIPMKDHLNPILENTVLLGKGTSSKNYASYIDGQTDPETEKDEIATGSITNSHTSIIPVTVSTSVSSEDINMENYYHVSETGTPLSLRYANTLRDYSFIYRPVTNMAKENNLDAMDLIIIEPGKSDSKYISNKHVIELEREENNSIEKFSQLAHGPNRFVSRIPFSKGKTSKSLLYRIAHPEFKTEENYQTFILKEENAESDILATSFKDYIKNFNTQHLETMVPSLIDEDEAFSSEFKDKSSAEKSMLSEEDVLILPEVSGLGNRNRKYFFVPYRKTITKGKSKTFNTVPSDNAMISIPIKSQDHSYRKGISSNVRNTAALELADSVTSEKSKANENKMDFSEVMPSENYINRLAQDIASQVENISYVGEVTKGIIKTASMASLNPDNANKMPTNATTISHSVSAFDSKKSNENGESIMSAVDGFLYIKLKSLFIPNQKRLRTAIALSENDDSLADKSVALQVSEPLGEDFIIIDQNREVNRLQSDPQTFSMISSISLKDPTTFSKNPLNIVTGIPTPENVGINDKTDTMAFAPNIAPQSIIYKKGQIGQTSDLAISHHVNKAIIDPSVKEITTSETEINAFLRKDTAALEDESHISETKIPMNLRGINSLNINPFIFKPDVASAEQKAPGTLKEIFYPDSTMSTTKLTKARAGSSFSLDNYNLERYITNSYNNLHHLPLKPVLPPTGFIADFIKINHFELNPAFNKRESNIKMTDESNVSNESIVLPDKEILSPDNIIFMDDIRNIINEIHVGSTERDNVNQYEDFSAESDVVFPAGENNPNNRNLSTVGLGESTIKYVSEENTFNVGEEGKSPITKPPIFLQGLHRFESHAPFPTAHVTGNLLNENPVELKTKQKYQILISRKENFDSDKEGHFLEDYTTKFKSKSPRTMTPSLTDANKRISSRFPNDFIIESSTLYENDIITIFPEGKWIEKINAPEVESMKTIVESRSFSEEITDITTSAPPIIWKGQLYRRYVPDTAFYEQRKSTISPKSEYNQDKTFTAENYHLQDATAPSVTFNVNLDNELPFVDKDSENTNNKPSISSSAIKTAVTMADTPASSLQNSYEGGDSMQPHENNARSREFPFLLTNESVILMPKALNEDFILISDNSLTDSSKSVSGELEAVTEYLDLIHGIDISENRDIQIQRNLQPHPLDSITSPFDSITFTRSSTDDEDISTSTVERDTVNFKVKTDAQPLSMIMKVFSQKQRSPFPSEIREMVKLSDEEDKATKFNSGPIINATVLIPTLEKAFLSTSDPSVFSKSNNNKGEKLGVSGASNFVLEDLSASKNNLFIDKFNISAKLQASPYLKRIYQVHSPITMEKTVLQKDKNSVSSDEDISTAGLDHNAPIGTYKLQWKSTFSPDSTTSVSLSKYSELDRVVKMKKDTTTKTNNNIPFEERNTPSHKAIISPSTNTLTKDMWNTILNKKFAHRYFVGKDIIPEYEVVSITENISDIALVGENIPNNKYVISTVLDDRVLEYAANEYALEPQKGKNNPIIKRTTANYGPKIVDSYTFYSSDDASEYLSQGTPTEIKTEEILQNLITTEELTNSNLDAAVPKSSTDNMNSRALKSMSHSLTHESENFHKFLGKTTLKRNTQGEDDTIIILPEDKKIDYTLVPDSEITVTMVEGMMFPHEPIDPIVITPPLKNKNQFYRKVPSSAIYNTDAQGQAENVLSFKVNNIKGKTNMAETQHSWDSIVPLVDFSIIPDGKFFFTNEDTEILDNRALISSSPVNTVDNVDDVTILSTESSYEGDDSMLSEDNRKLRGFLVLQIPKKPMFIPYDLTKNLEISDPVTSDFLANPSIEWSNKFESTIEYPNFINDGDSPLKNKNDLKAYSLTSTKLPTGFTSSSDNPTSSEFDLLSLVNRETTDLSKIDTDQTYSEPQRTIMKAFSPTKVSQRGVYDERKIANFSNQDLATKFDLSHIINATFHSPSMQKIFSSVTKPNTLSKNDNNVEEIHISKAGNIFPKDASSLKDNYFAVELGATFTKPQTPLNLKGIFSIYSTLSLPEAYRSNNKNSSLEVTTGVETIANIPTGTYDLASWKSTLLSSDFTKFRSSTKSSELDPVIKMEKDTTTKTNNIVPPGERNTPSDKAIILPTVIISTKDMKNTINTINNSKFGDKFFIKKDIPTEEISFIENISKDTHYIFLAGESIQHNDDIITIMPIDNALQYVEGNYVFELVKEENGPLIEKITLIKDSNVFESHAPFASATTLELLLQGLPIDIKTTKKHQSLVPKEETANSDNDATVIKGSTINFNTKAPRSMTYSLTGSSWIFFPEFLDKTVMENNSLNSVIILPKVKRMKYSLISDSELITIMGKSRIFITDPINPAVITSPTEFEDRFNRKDVSSAFYNNAIPDEAKITILAILDATKHKPNFADMPHSQKRIPLAEFNVITDDLSFISKNSEEEKNIASIFSSSMNKGASTMGDSIVLSTEGSYVGGNSGEDNVKSRRFPSLLTSGMLIPNSLTKNPETSGLMTDNLLSESLITRSEMLERTTEYADAINGGDVPERQVVITQADVNSYPWNVPPTGSTFSGSTTDGEVDSFFTMTGDTLDNHKTKTDKMYSKSLRAMMKAFSPRKDSQNNVYKRRKIANIFDQEDPAAELKLSHFTNTLVSIPSIKKIFLSETKSNPLSEGDNIMNNYFTLKFDATSFRPQIPSNLKGIFLADSTLTLPKVTRPTTHDEVTKTGRSIANIPASLYGLQWRLGFPPSDFTTSTGTSKYSELVPVTIIGKDTTKMIDYTIIPPEKIIILSDKIILSPIIITSEKDMASTFKGNICDHKGIPERERAAE